jgi:hypothetical protein
MLYYLFIGNNKWYLCNNWPDALEGTEFQVLVLLKDSIKNDPKQYSQFNIFMAKGEALNEILFQFLYYFACLKKNLTKHIEYIFVNN